MRTLPWLGLALFAAGGIVLGLAVARGEATLSLVVIVPVVAATGALGLLGIVLILAAFLVTFVAWPFRVAREAGGMAAEEPIAPEGPGPSRPARRWGGVLFLGPVPVVFGSDAKVTRGMLVLGFALFLALLALTLIVLFAGA
jgi:uncharacterized membrane protein